MQALPPPRGAHQAEPPSPRTRLRKRASWWRGPAHELEVTASAEIRTLASEIGMFSKDAALANLVSRISQDRCGGGREPAPGPTRPTLVAAGAAADRQLSLIHI